MQKPARSMAMICISVFCFSCSSTNLMTMSVQEPAPVTLPPYIKTIGIVNRSNVARENKVIDVADKIFSLEGAGLDKAGATSSIEGLSEELIKENRFEEVKVLQDNLTTVNPTVYPSPLSWNIVEQICRENHADALFSLELFDTDSKVSYAANPAKINTPLGQIPAIEHQANMLTSIKAGWRIYDPVGKNILDEFAVNQHINYTARGINPVVAANALIGRKEAVKEVGNRSGHAYALRIVPFEIRVSRDYYVKGTGNFVIAKRRAQTGHWDEAAALWQEEVNNRNHKVAGRACYNMAIINEINGNLDKAIGWAQKSYEDYNNRLALRYVNILKDRKFRNGILKEQLAMDGSK